jgi:hypothetical protein
MTLLQPQLYSRSKQLQLCLLYSRSKQQEAAAALLA